MYYSETLTLTLILTLSDLACVCVTLLTKLFSIVTVTLTLTLTLTGLTWLVNPRSIVVDKYQDERIEHCVTVVAYHRTNDCD